MPTTTPVTDHSSIDNIDNNKQNTTTDTHANQPHYLMWFRRDLRLHDNTALTALCEHANSNNAQVSAVFFCTPAQWQSHDTSLVQVDHIIRTLTKLAQSLEKQLNIPLTVYVCDNFSDCTNTIIEICATKNISIVMANHEYEGNEIARDEQLIKPLAKNNIEFIRWHDQCILPPKSITTNDDSMYQVFTPFYKKWRHTLDVSSIQTYTAPAVIANNNLEQNLKPFDSTQITAANTPKEIEALGQTVVEAYQQRLQAAGAVHIDSINNLDSNAQLIHARSAYPAGEVAACHRIDQFIAEDITRYDVSRDVPSLNATSQLSAYLTIGVISARHCYLQATKALDNAASTHANKDSYHSETGDNTDINRWISELAWRDFYRHVLVAKPELIRHYAYNKELDSRIHWSYNDEDFKAWCNGKTGVPLVDAAMRCLNATGFMHNRLRMVTAMFLTKDLLIDWRLGERYFMQRLIDGDFASNNGGWQWSASTGTDAAPYFRIMNPFSQGKSHDPDGEFITTWLPELKNVPTNILHSEDKLRAAVTKGGKFSHINYPAPMVHHKIARQLAIDEFKN